MKSEFLDVSDINCARPGMRGSSNTQMCGRLLDFSISVAMASSAASSETSSSGLWEFAEGDLRMLTSGSPGQKEIKLTPTGSAQQQTYDHVDWQVLSLQLAVAPEQTAVVSSFLTIDEHLETGSAGSPGEIELAACQNVAMLDYGCLPCVELRC